jgi:hypothetical protein
VGCVALINFRELRAECVEQLWSEFVIGKGGGGCVDGQINSSILIQIEPGTEKIGIRDTEGRGREKIDRKRKP